MNRRAKIRAGFAALLLLFFAVGTLHAAFAGNPGNMEPDADRSRAAALLLLYMLLALGFSFLCSIAEAVLLSLRPSFIESTRKKDPRLASLMTRLKLDNIDRSLAAILTLNTIAHTVGAIGAGAQASILFGSTWFGLFSAVMTLMILFLSEIVPKTIGAVYWKGLAKPISYTIHGLILCLYPIVWLSEKLTGLISGGKDVHVFSRDEFLAMARLGEKSGHLDLEESRIILNLFRMGALNTEDIMTPRTVVFTLPEKSTVRDVLPQIIDRPFSRIPLIEKDKDHITGFVLRDDVLLAEAEGNGEKTLQALKRELLAVPETMPVSSLLETFVQGKRQVALVVDEYGGTKGLATLEDVVETLIGAEITDEMDKVADMRVLARRLWERRSRAMGVRLDDDDQPAVTGMNGEPKP